MRVSYGLPVGGDGKMIDDCIHDNHVCDVVSYARTSDNCVTQPHQRAGGWSSNGHISGDCIGDGYIGDGRMWPVQ
jgi:hypothetical protein